MITADEVLRIAQLRHALGERRSGYLLDDAACVEGPFRAPRTSSHNEKNDSGESGNGPSILVSFDSKTGRLIIEPGE